MEAETLLPSFASVTDVGLVRSQNEDAHQEVTLEGGVLLVVCDGMGGHEHGDVASRLAVEAITQVFQNSPASDPRERLDRAFRVANQRIVTEAERSRAQGMGTTAVAAFVHDDEAYVAHVGDSRLYHIRDGRVHWQTTDHTRVQKMVAMNILSPAEAKTHPDANIVNRALGFPTAIDGTPLEPEVQARPLMLVRGDTLVMCSDGLYDGVSDDEIIDLIGGRTSQEAAQALVDRAKQAGGHDNITVTVLHAGVTTGVRNPEQTSSPPRHTILDRPDTVRTTPPATIALPELSSASAATVSAGPASPVPAGGAPASGAPASAALRWPLMAMGAIALLLCGVVVGLFLRQPPLPPASTAKPTPDAGSTRARESDAKDLDASANDARKVGGDADSRTARPAVLAPTTGAPGGAPGAVEPSQTGGGKDPPPSPVSPAATSSAKHPTAPAPKPQVHPPNADAGTAKPPAKPGPRNRPGRGP